MSRLRTVTFGSLSGPWGAAWCAEQGVLLLDGSATPVEDRGGSDAESWTIVGDGIELAAAGEGEAITRGEPFDAFDQLCRVTGSVRVDGAQLEIDALGRRAARESEALDECESLRDVSAWFEPDAGLALTALRPRKAKGHGRDLITAAVLNTSEGAAVDDPRMSTTYSADGAPLRVGLELWIGEDEDSQRLRRAAGEAAGAGVVAATGAHQLHATPLRWHSRGREGAGVYLLARAG